MSKRRDWFKWKIRAGTRGTIRRASRRNGNGFEVIGACIAMLDHARSASHYSDNPEGVFSTTIEDLAIDYSTPAARVREALGALVATGWLKTNGDVAVVSDDADLSIRVVRYLAFNDPQGSDADRKAAQRDRESVAANAVTFRALLESDIDASLIAESANLQATVTDSHKPAEMSLEEKREEEKREEKTSIVAPSNKPRKPRKTKALTRVSDPELDARVSACFDWYCQLFGKTGQSALSLSQKRYDAIAWALTEYSGEQVAECLKGYHSEPWRRERLSRHDIKKLLESQEQVEAGIDLAIGAANTAAAGGDERTAALVAFYAQQKTMDGAA